MTAAGTLLWILGICSKHRNSYRGNNYRSCTFFWRNSTYYKYACCYTSAAGHLTAADWNTFNSKQAGNANLSIAALTLQPLLF
jgi:hypothetical protein